MALVTLLVNIAMAALLAVTITYCWILNRRIQILQDSKSELSQLLKHFDESTARASESIIALQTASKKIGENIQHRVDKANYILDDLTFMLEKGDKLVNQLEANMAVAKAKNRVAASEEPLKDSFEDRMPEVVPSNAPAAPANEKKRASLEAMLERVIARTKPNWPTVDKDSPTVVRTRSEQELVEMLRSGIKG